MITLHSKPCLSRYDRFAIFVIMLLGPAGMFSQTGQKCLQPSFTINVIGQNLIELVTEAEADSNFIVSISELAAGVESSEQRKTAELNSDTARVRNGRAINVFKLTGFRLMKSEGRVMVTYHAISKSPQCPQWNSGTFVVQAMETSHLDVNAGILFGLGVSGALKGQPEFAVSASTKHTPWFSSFGEFRYTSIAALDTISTSLTQEQFFNPFAEGGGVFDMDLGFMIHPFYKEWEQEIFALIVGGGFRTFAQEGIKEVFGLPRVFAGMHMNILEYNTQDDDAGLRGVSGYAEFGFAYDEFWHTEIDTGSGIQNPFFEPRRLFFEGQLDFIVGNDKIPISARLTTDIPLKGKLKGGKIGLNFGVVVGIDATKVAELLGGITRIFR